MHRNFGLPLHHEGDNSCGDQHRYQYVEAGGVAAGPVVDESHRVGGRGPEQLPDGRAQPDELPQGGEPERLLQDAELGRDPDAVADAVAEGEGVEHPGCMQEQQPRYRERHTEQGNGQRSPPANSTRYEP